MRPAELSAIGIDVEHSCDMSYRGTTCLIQISTPSENYVIDPLPIFLEVRLLNNITMDAAIVKVLHNAEMDVAWLQVSHRHKRLVPFRLLSLLKSSTFFVSLYLMRHVMGFTLHL